MLACLVFNASNDVNVKTVNQSVTMRLVYVHVNQDGEAITVRYPVCLVIMDIIVKINVIAMMDVLVIMKLASVNVLQVKLDMDVNQYVQLDDLDSIVVKYVLVQEKTIIVHQVYIYI